MSGETMDNLVWKDLWYTAQTVKVYELCCTRYSNKMKRRNRIYEWIIIALPLIGAALYKLNPLFTLIASILTGLEAILEKFKPFLTQSEKELSELQVLQGKFAEILSDIEDGILSFRVDSATDSDLKTLLTKKKKQISKLSPLLDSIVRTVPDNEHLNDEALNYLNSKYNV